jgi:hypothetical protein
MVNVEESILHLRIARKGICRQIGRCPYRGFTSTHSSSVPYCAVKSRAHCAADIEDHTLSGWHLRPSVPSLVHGSLQNRLKDIIFKLTGVQAA